MSQAFTRDSISEPGLSSDPVIFKVLTEIDMIAHLAANAFARALPDGMTPAQFGVLHRLSRLSASETIGELAKAFQVAQPTMSSTVAKLAEKGLVEIIPDAGDRRVRRIKPTAKGAKIRQEAVDAVTPQLTAFAETASDIDWEAMLPALGLLRAHLGLPR